MSESLKDILSNLNPEVDQETLLLYLQGKLTAEQQHEVEKGMMKDHFEADALEGLQSLKSRKDLSLLVDQLNRDLRKRTDKKKKFREKLKIKEQPWLWMAAIIILMLIVISYIIIHKLLQQ
jgi:hypothetical protein